METAHKKFGLEDLTTHDRNPGLASLAPQDLLLILEDAITTGNLDVVQDLTQQPELSTFLLQNRHGSQHVLNVAAYYSSPELLLWLLEKFTVHLPNPVQLETQALHVAIESENLPNIKLLLSHNLDIMASANLPDDFKDITPDKGNPHIPGLLRALRRWNADLMRFLVDDCGVRPPRKWPTHLDGLSDPGFAFAPRYILDKNNNNNNRSRALDIDELRGRFNVAVKPYLVSWPEAFCSGVCFAVHTGSPALVRVCLEAGGDPDGRPAQYPFHPLYEAVQRGKPEIVELLLQFGADPEPRVEYKRKEIEKLVGMKKVEEYFGVPWKEIVKSVREGEFGHKEAKKRRREE
ncbi:hypothetical protein VTJ49DRAFT_207 [Mycothermus thermophilus]|uniref:Ankyrin n=1 Tax=Humicola insolens TaxID=85995 RepID=A0ABR3VG89_HUMIN